MMMILPILTLGAMAVGSLFVESVYAHPKLSIPTVSHANHDERRGPVVASTATADSVSSNCFPANGFTMPSTTPSSLNNWWCDYDTEYAFIGFSYEVTACQSLATLKRDFLDIKKRFHGRYVRIYGFCDNTGFYNDVIEAAWTAGLGVHALIWFGFDGDDMWKQRRDELFGILHSNPKAKFITRVVQFGSEPLFDDVLNAKDLAAQVRAAKANLSSLHIPLTISEMAYGWQEREGDGAGEIMDAIDLIDAHMLPFFSTQASTASKSWPIVLADLDWFVNNGQNKKIYLSENGWPSVTSDGVQPNSPSAVADVQNEADYYKLLDEHCSYFKTVAGGGVGWFAHIYSDNQEPGYGIYDSNVYNYLDSAGFTSIVLMAAASSTRALNAILPQIPTAPYEAHQKARTFAARYVKSNQYDTAIDVLFQSARELFKNGQPGSGSDLTAFLLDVYDTKGETVNDESRGRLTQLIALAGPSGGWRKTIIDKSIAWSAKHGVCPAGDQDLHHYVGELLHKEGAFEVAEVHLLASGKRDSARLLAEMFIHWASPDQVYGLFAIRGTIPYLQNGNILAAHTFIKHFTAGLPSSLRLDSDSVISVGEKDEVIMTTDPLVNFAQMALLTCQRAQGDQNKVMRESWIRLCGTYQGMVSQLATPEMRSCLNEIATLYFAIPPPRNQAANPFGDMMSSLFGGPVQGQPKRRVLTPATAASPGLD